MDVLLDDDVSRERDVEDPVAHARGLGIGIGLFAEAAAVVVELAADRRADKAVVYALGGALEVFVHAGLEIHPGAKFAAYAFRRVDDVHAAGHVHRDGLGEVKVLAGFERVNALRGMEIGRRDDRHGVHIARDELFVAVEPDVAARCVHLEHVARGVCAVAEIVMHRHDPGVAEFVEKSAEPRAASAAADQPDLYFFVRFRAAHGPGGHDGKGGGCRGGGFEEIAAFDVLFAGHSSSFLMRCRRVS